MIIYPSEYFRNWYYVGKHTSKLRNRAAVEYRINVLDVDYLLLIQKALVLYTAVYLKITVSYMSQ